MFSTSDPECCAFPVANGGVLRSVSAGANAEQIQSDQYISEMNTEVPGTEEQII